MSRTADSRSVRGSRWVDRVRAHIRTAPPAVKTDETLVDDHMNTGHPTDKTDETPCAEAITSVLAVAPAVHVKTHPSAPVTESRPRALVNRGMLMTVGHYHGYPLLPLKPGVSVAEGYTAWRTFTRFSDDAMLALAVEAARATWSDDPMTRDLFYVEPDENADDAPCRNDNGVCQDRRGGA